MTYAIEFRSGGYLGFKDYKRRSVRLSWARLFASKKKAERIAGEWAVAGALLAQEDV